MKLHQLLSYPTLKQFLTQYHKVVHEEFGIQPLGVGKALVALSKVLGYENQHTMSKELANKTSLLTVKKDIIIITRHSVISESVTDTHTEVFTCIEKADNYRLRLFCEYCCENDMPTGEICDALLLHETYREHEGLEDLVEDGDTDALLDWLVENKTGAQLSPALKILSYKSHYVTEQFTSIEMEVNEGDIT